MNSVNIRGYVTKDSTICNIGQNNTECLNFTIAQNKSFKNERGNIEKKAMFFDVSVYGKYAAAINFLSKGTLVFIQGQLTQESWEKNSNKYSKVSIIASKIYPCHNQTKNSQNQ